MLVNKPSGLLSVPGKAQSHQDCLELRVRAILPDALLVHRLDHPTSGLMIFARNAHAQRHLGLQFEKRQTEKIYIANVWGHVAGTSGYINLPLICDWPNRPRQMVCFLRGKTARTDYEVLQKDQQTTRLALYPHTGRSHQLRVHCLSLGHPILGDSFYAHDPAYTAAPRLHLHAYKLSFRHPSDGKPVTFTCPCPF